MKLSLTLYITLAISGSFGASIATDEAAKYVEPETLFWMRLVTGVIFASATTLKAYTSETFARWNKKETDNEPKQEP